jgi:hypothetical protein
MTPPVQIFTGAHRSLRIQQEGGVRTALTPKPTSRDDYFSALLMTRPSQRREMAAREFERQVSEFQVCVAVLNGFTALGPPIQMVAG